MRVWPTVGFGGYVAISKASLPVLASREEVTLIVVHGDLCDEWDRIDGRLSMGAQQSIDERFLDVI
jgi:hypothetical protein